MNSISGAATGEINRILHPVQAAIRDIYTNEPEVKLCHGCGEINTPEYCLCTAEQKAQLAQIESHK